MAYHKFQIPPGVYGEFSKVVEEWIELMDARHQQNPILELCELSDLIGAIEGYVQQRYNLTIHDVLEMAAATKYAFESGDRK